MSDDAIAAGIVEAARRAVDHPQHDAPEPHGDPLADVVPAEAPAAAADDWYTTADAARLLGISDRRVRQLVEEGRLPAETDAGVLRLPQEPVHQERARRRQRRAQRVRSAEEASGSAGRQRAPSAADPEAIAAAVAAAVAQVLAGQRELTAQAASLVEAERARFEAERERRMALEEEVLELRARLAGATGSPTSSAELAPPGPAAAVVEPVVAEQAPSRRRWWRGSR